jgi:hypothetical protein
MAKIDERYKRGKIYTIRCRYDDSLIYIGSTIEKLSIRMAKHRYNKSCSLYKYVDGNWDDWYIELYEEFPCNNKQLLEKKEGEVIREIGTINNRIEGRTYKEWYEDNREKIFEYNKEYQKYNREIIAEQQKKYYQVNREKINEKHKEYYENNSDKILEKYKEKIKCDICDCDISIQYLKKHQRTKKCMNYNLNNK